MADRPFVRSVDLDTEAIVIRGRILLEQDRFLQVYFNEETGTTAFALIEGEQRIWGIDYDELRGWHEHPVERPSDHQDIEPMPPSEVVDKLEAVWTELL